ncbi:MAG: hypothetical protein KF856_09350 [Cyclobacteriaceae bacterium]|nr:hypothetical protein [Cyclobacteriaceae bacterium]
MKTIFILACVLMFAMACSNPGGSSGFSVGFSKGVKADFSTGAKTSYTGFGIENIYVVDAEDNQLSDNELSLDSKFSIVYEGVENYTLKDGKAFPGLSIAVTDASGAYVLNETDLFSTYTEGFDPEAASVLRGSITVGNPMQAGNSYLCKIRVFDKNSDSEIVTEMSFKVKE